MQGRQEVEKIKRGGRRFSDQDYEDIQEGRKERRSKHKDKRPRDSGSDEIED